MHRNVYNEAGEIIALIDSENRIVTGYHRVEAARRLTIPLFVLDGDGKLAPAKFADDPS